MSRHANSVIRPPPTIIRPAPSSVRAVLFDLGDTLVHFETWQARRFFQVAMRPGYERLCELGYAPPPFEKYARAIRRTFIASFLWSRLRRREIDLNIVFGRRHARMGLDVTPEHLTDLISYCTNQFRELFSTDEEAVPVLSELHAHGFPLGIVSNTMFPPRAIDDMLEHDGLLKWFPVRVYSSGVGYMKPHPKIFTTALERMGVAAEDTVFIGDRIDKDVRGAARVGMKTILMRRDGKVPRGRPRPDYIIHRLSELPPLLQNIR